MGWEIMQLKLHSNFSGDATDQLGTIRKAGKTMNWLPMDAERLLGEHEHMELTGKILDAKREKNKPILQSKALLAELTKQIKEPTPYRFEIYVMRASNGNAQALPGGIIHIDLDLVKPVPIPDKAYFALAHELSHILQRHETRAVQARLTDSIDSVDGLRKIIATAQQQPDGLLVYTNDIMQRFVTFSENQELQADACAVRILHGVFQEPRRLTQVIRAFQDSLGPATSATMTPNQIDTWVQNVGKMGNLGDQHPNSQLREKNLQAMLALVASPGK
jgi:predicted Zn-dependent protease